MSKPRYVAKEHKYNKNNEREQFDKYLNEMTRNGYRLTQFQIYNHAGEMKVFSLLELEMDKDE